ncbi:NAD(P)/FAD-dependent oxidoreductase [Streptomyces sp. NPDC048219]|uniref:NAD(P)/FAD-dependent oxidoreductase n=1 Tax=Streptomyces sp. NPDC048219 TaxID=3365517 RepID=UPI003715631B
MSEPSPLIPRRAVVIGGSIAGMLAAAAVKDHFDTVEIVEAHALPVGPESRAGVPQAAHFHTLLSGGAEAIDELLPGTVDQLLAAGANRVPVTTGMVMYSPEGWYRRWQNATHYLITASRDLTDSVIRQQVLKHQQVSVREHTRVVSLLGDRQRITGVRLRSADGAETELPAELVVDASGRGTRTPRWLAELGITGLVDERIDSGLTYASRIYQAPVPTKDWPVINLQANARAGLLKAGGIIPIENDRWHVSLIGPPGAEPTRNTDDFLPYARSLRHPVVADLLEHAEPLTEVTVTHTTANVRYRYELLKSWPEGLVAVGDSVAAFNPVYGQGMGVAARGARALHKAVSVGLTDGLARRAQCEVAAAVDAAWSLSVGSDIHFPSTKGKDPTAGDRLLQRYVSRLSRTATGSHRVATALTDVLMLQASPASLLSPSLLLAAALGPRRPQLAGPPLSPVERLVLDRGAASAVAE